MINNLAKSTSQGAASNAGTDYDDVNIGKMIGSAFFVNGRGALYAMITGIQRVSPIFHNKMV